MSWPTTCAIPWCWHATPPRASSFPTGASSWVLGAGYQRGEQVWSTFGIPYDAGGIRVARLAEALGIVKSLLQGRETSSSGAYYNLTGARIFPAPVQQPHPPILIAAAGKRMLALAAREADIVARPCPRTRPRASWPRR